MEHFSTSSGGPGNRKPSVPVLLDTNYCVADPAQA